jgi:hypothetical protein
LLFAYYNFRRVHMTLKETPANGDVEAGKIAARGEPATMNELRKYMSLSVDVFTRDELGKMVVLYADDHSQELAGFEVFRQTFYGGQAARYMGLRLLPSLAEGDLYAERDDLPNLQNEATLVLQNIDLFTEEAAAKSEVLRFRIQNILDAIQRAQKVGGGVVIW